MFICISTCVCACPRRPKVSLRCHFSDSFYHCVCWFLRYSLPLSWPGTTQTKLAVQQSSGMCLLSLLRVGTAHMEDYMWFIFTWELEVEHMSSCLCDMHAVCLLTDHSIPFLVCFVLIDVVGMVYVGHSTYSYEKYQEVGLIN